MISKIDEFNSMELHPDTQRIDCEVFQGNETISIRAFMMDEDLNEVFNSEGQTFVDGSIELLHDIDYHPSYETVSRIYDRFDQEADTLFIDTVVDWFSHCITKSEVSVDIPVYIKRHGSGWTFDLQTKEWIELY